MTVGNSDRTRQRQTADNSPIADFHLRTTIMGEELWLPSEKERADGFSKAEGICETRLQARSANRPVQILRHTKPRIVDEYAKRANFRQARKKAY